MCLQIHPSTDGAAAGTEGWQAMLARCAKGAHDARAIAVVVGILQAGIDSKFKSCRIRALIMSTNIPQSDAPDVRSVGCFTRFWLKLTKPSGAPP